MFDQNPPPQRRWRGFDAASQPLFAIYVDRPARAFRDDRALSRDGTDGFTPAPR